MKDFLSRWQGQTIETVMKERRVLLLVGPRQCGKTTLVRRLDPKNTDYHTLDDEISMELAEISPFKFVSHEKGMLIIDEIQKFPKLLPVIKRVVDQNREPGQFLLTGSANVQSLPSVRESLAGRVSRIRLRPFTEGEIRNSEPGFLERAFSQDFGGGWQNYDRGELIETALRGGYPEAVSLGERARRRWHEDYVNALMGEGSEIYSENTATGNPARACEHSCRVVFKVC